MLTLLKLKSTDIQKHFPVYNLKRNEKAYYEPQGGLVRPEKAIQTQLELAKRLGASLQSNEKVLEIRNSSTRAPSTIVTDKATYTTEKIILTCGPWIKDFLPESLRANFTIYRQVLYWFDLKDKSELKQYESLPVSIWLFDDRREDFVYIFPAIDGADGGVKVATETYKDATDPDTVSRKVRPEESHHMYEHYVKDKFPGLSNKCLKAKACLYTSSSDYGFIIDWHPQNEHVLVVSPCSGHGFKHSGGIGHLASQLVQHERDVSEISQFSLKRFN